MQLPWFVKQRLFKDSSTTNKPDLKSQGRRDEDGGCSVGCSAISVPDPTKSCTNKGDQSEAGQDRSCQATITCVNGEDLLLCGFTLL